MAVYSVRNKGTGLIRLVDADQRSQALRHVASDTFEVLVAKPRQAFELAGLGVKLENYKPDADEELEQIAPSEAGAGA